MSSLTRYSSTILLENNDIAIGILNITWNHSGKPIPFLDLNGRMNQPEPNSMLTIAGWGLTREFGNGSPLLLEASVPVISQDECQRVFGSITRITEKTICAGYLKGGVDTCQGDSGGPLFKDNILYGVTSGGYGCARPNCPGMYMKVSHYHKWIKDLLDAHKIDD